MLFLAARANVVLEVALDGSTHGVDVNEECIVAVQSVELVVCDTVVAG